MKSLILVFLLMSGISLATAQKSKPGFSLDLYTGYFSVPLFPDNLLNNMSGVSGVLTLDKLNVRGGFESNLLQDTKSRRYDLKPGLVLGAGYVLFENTSKNTFGELNVSLTNNFQEFLSFKNYLIDTGIRFYMFRSFYIGTGIRYFNEAKADFSEQPVDGLNWYWQMGIRLNLKKGK